MRLPRTNSATGTSVNSAPLRRTERPVPKNSLLYKLLRNGGSSASAIAFQIVFGSDLDLVPIEPMVLVEARILRGLQKRSLGGVGQVFVNIGEPLQGSKHWFDPQ